MVPSLTSVHSLCIWRGLRKRVIVPVKSHLCLGNNSRRFGLLDFCHIMLLGDFNIPHALKVNGAPPQFLNQCLILSLILHSDQHITMTNLLCCQPDFLPRLEWEQSVVKFDVINCSLWLCDSSVEKRSFSNDSRFCLFLCTQLHDQQNASQVKTDCETNICS